MLVRTILGLLTFVLSAALASSESSAVDVPDAIANDPNFQIQGEYLGEVTKPEGKQSLGVQVSARGDGKFVAIFYAGGLPGEGWDKSGSRNVDGQTADGVPTFKDGDSTVTIQGGTMLITNPSGTKIGELKKVTRKSSTLGEKPPTGAVVLFDSTNAEQFANGRMTDDGLLREGSTSKRKFQSGKLHLEFRLPFDLKDPQRGNSGCYLQGRYEVQILNSFGLPPHNHECGGIPGVKAADVNMSYPAFAWQTYDIDFKAAEFQAGQKVKNARMTVRHNGVLVQQDVEVPQTTQSAMVSQEGPEPGPIDLQDHSSAVRFRNLWFVESP